MPAAKRPARGPKLEDGKAPGEGTAPFWVACQCKSPKEREPVTALPRGMLGLVEVASAEEGVYKLWMKVPMGSMRNPSKPVTDPEAARPRVKFWLRSLGY